MLGQASMPGYNGGQAATMPGPSEIIVLGQAAAGDTLKVGVATWNVGNEEPFWGKHAEGLAKLVPLHDGYSIFALGVQECTFNVGERHKGDDEEGGDHGHDEQMITPEELAQAKEKLDTLEFHKFGSSGGDHFDGLIEAHATRNNCSVVASASLAQMRLLVIANNAIKDRIDHIELDREATGFAHLLPNKGGLLIKIQVDRTILAFISCHLNAHLHHFKRRIQDCSEILGGVHCMTGHLDPSICADHTFFFGDLNFRTDLEINVEAGVIAVTLGDIPPGHKEDMESPEHNAHFEKVAQLVEDRNWEEMMKHDQLQYMLRSGLGLHGFQEGSTTFQPTFKVLRRRQLVDSKPDTCSTEYNPSRASSWCDRILWTSLPAYKTHLEQTELVPVPECDTSDHKPVRASFQLRLARVPAVLDRMRASNGKLASALEPDERPLRLLLRDLTYSEAEKKGNWAAAWHVQITVLPYLNQSHVWHRAQSIGTALKGLKKSMSGRLNVAKDDLWTTNDHSRGASCEVLFQGDRLIEVPVPPECAAYMHIVLSIYENLDGDVSTRVSDYILRGRFNLHIGEVQACGKKGCALDGHLSHHGRRQGILRGSALVAAPGDPWYDELPLEVATTFVIKNRCCSII